MSQVGDMPVAPLPDMSRLLAVWDGTDEGATSLEYATRAFVTMWRVYLADIDIRAVEHSQEQDFLPCDVIALRSSIARAVDDEVTWLLGNRRGTVAMIDDDREDIVTVGELFGQITMLGEVLAKQSEREAPLASRYRQTWDSYESLRADLILGNRRQPRRRSHGPPPIPKPAAALTRIGSPRYFPR